VANLQQLLLLNGWLDPQSLIDKFGAYALFGAALVIFIECWLFPFLPGDSLLFTIGLLIASSDTVGAPLWVACLVLSAAAVLSNVVGYLVGARLGPAVFNRPESRFFKAEYVDKTYAFFDRYGSRAIVLARFVPIVRTFITLAAGAGRMPMRRFLTYSAIGGVLWATGLTLLGYWLGQVSLLAKHLDLVLVGLVLLSLLPLIFEVLRGRSSRRERYDEDAERSRVVRKQTQAD
jgi:membrane-associated protein